MSMVSSSSALTAESISARLERLPLSRWHIKARVIVGAVTFFDGFDQLMLAYSLPELAPKWGLTASDIAWLIAIGGIGMLVGALGGGWFADRVGRLNVIMFSLALYAVMSLGMAFTDSLMLFLVFRFIQGIGLGAEVPVAATYIGEITKAHGRGTIRAALRGDLPDRPGRFGRRVVLGRAELRLQGAVRPRCHPDLPDPLIRKLPESPRWYAARNRLDDADAAMTEIENEITNKYGKTLPDYESARSPRSSTSAPASPSVPGRLPASQPHAGRHLGLTAYFVNYGIASWLPTLY